MTVQNQVLGGLSTASFSSGQLKSLTTFVSTPSSTWWCPRRKNFCRFNSSMMSIKGTYQMKYLRNLVTFVMLTTRCMDSRAVPLDTQRILWGMVAGAAVGAIVGNSSSITESTISTNRKTRRPQRRFLCGNRCRAQLALHEMQEREVEISGRFARTRLCDPNSWIPRL